MQPLDQTHKGWLAWFARNSVASNLLMVILLLAGMVSVFTIKKQTFPEIQLEQVTIRVPYLGAAPQEVEEGIVDKIEESLRSLNGIKKIRSNAVEGLATVNVEIKSGYDIQEVMNEIKMQVDSISSFPEQTERPVIYHTKFQSNVLWLSVYGDTDQRGLKEFAKDVRDELKKLPGVSKVEVVGALDYEVSIEVSEHKLREYGLTFNQIVSAVRGSSVDLPGGSIKADNGNILLRAKGQAYRQQDFADIVLINRADGTRLLLGDIARVNDGFVEMESFSTFNGKPSVSIKVDAVGEDNTLKIAAAVKDYVQKKKADLPDSMNIDYWGDSSYYLQGRLDLMTDNMLMGALLVLISLTLFLEFRVAFWVMVGIPVCFLGTIALMPLSMFDVSINMISLFGFILVLGILVDDAIIIGESAYTEIEKYGKSAETVIRGAQRVAMPATFGVLTTIAAFIPMLMVGGPQGPIWESIAWVVILCLMFSMVESKFILPAHLIAMDSKPWDPERNGLFYSAGRSCSNGLKWVRTKVSGATDRFVYGRYQRAIAWCIEYRYITATSFFAMMVLMIGLMAGGHVRWVFFPNIPSDFINANLTMMEGSSGQATVQAMRQLEAALVKTNEQIIAKGEEGLVKHRLTFTESDTRGELVIELEKSEGRDIDANEFVRLWREQIPEIAGVKTLQIFSSTSGGGGGDISFQLKSKELEQLRLATEELKTAMSAYQGVYDIEDSISGGNDEIVLKIKPQAEALGISLSDLATQVRQGFYGAEAQRIQRDGEEVKVMVRYPKEERRSVGNLENMKIRTASGAEVPFSQVAEYTAQPSYSAINRVDGERSVTISASVDKALAEPMKITKELQEKVLPQLAQKYGIETALEGASLEEADAMTDLALGFLLALFVIYALLAIPLKSYTQPLIIMSVIPFGLIGAILGHMMLGLSVSIMSLFGLIALAGVVVNDSLVMVDFVNESRRSGMPLKDAVIGAGTRRFRPIMLTSLTTFLGLAPIVLEKSLQAQIVVPMAVSLAYGILFATVITLLLIPALYVILDDFLGMFKSKKVEETTYPVDELPLQK
ncbi:efflux RND transporter permease subunit [Rheinheimera mesophila]|uniref:Efflux RND transporter permease subunit n=1 Tax=Rheinheimera mesophila TaxID=1547515 RepID=A0A3P3QEX3_9GAMM|nr:efflux RND transporter permease subunit [Rheinheimera mesophila]KKL02353.1 acriflavin resistance protein [Rheinheimera mesophila]RRJ19009.1 efflux RND transporter permease subunit [Rheinheimera mesophila]